MGIAVGLATGAGIGIGMGVISEYARLGIMYAKWKGWGKEQCRNTIPQLLQTVLSAEKNEVSGLSTKGTVDSLIEFLDKTLDIAWQLDETIAHQLWQQIIHQSVAYAVHTSLGGAIQTVGNVYAGSAMLSAGEANNIGSMADYVDRGTRGVLMAQVGQNIPTTAFNLLRGANSRLEDMYNRVVQQANSFVDEWNDLALNYYRHYHTLCRERFADAIKMKETTTDRAYGLLETIANEHLARIVEQLDTLGGAKSWWEGGFMGDDELKDISLRLDLEIQASIEDYNEHKTAIINAITESINEWDVQIDIALNDLTDSEYRFCVIARQMFDEVFADVTDFIKKFIEICENTIGDVCAYRNSVPPIGFVKVDPITKVEEHAENMVTRIPYRRYSPIVNYTVIGKYTDVDLIHWASDTDKPVLAVAEPNYTALERKRFVQVVPKTVIYEYEEIPLTQIIQVE